MKILQIKKTLVSLLILTVMFVMTFSASALTYYEYPKNTVDQNKLVEEVINSYSTVQDTVYKIYSSKKLRSLSDNSYIYTFYKLIPYGYAVILDETVGLIEACYQPDTVLPIDIDADYEYYYAGPNIYCYNNNGIYCDTNTGKNLNDSDISSIISVEDNIKSYERSKISFLTSMNSTNNIAGTLSTVTYTAQAPYFMALTNYGENVNGTCTVVAAQILMRYCDYYANNSYVASSYEDGTGSTESFHQLLNGYVYGSNPQGGIFIHDALSGINQYLSDVSIDARLASVNSSAAAARTKMTEMIQAGVPVIASTGTSIGADWNHTMLVYAVTYDSSNPSGTTAYTVHMGWLDDNASNRALVVSAGWFYECGYLTCPYSSHTYNSSWKDCGPTYHKRFCTCGASQSEMHTDYWVYPGICTRCGRTGPISGTESVEPILY